MKYATRVATAGLVAITACATSSSGDVGGGSDDTTSVDAGRGGGSEFADAAPGCETLTATVRDLRSGHPDFERFKGDEVYTGLVQPDLGADGKPVYAHPAETPHTTGPAEFAQWYNDIAGVNRAVSAQIQLVERADGVYEFDDQFFFPVDGRGFADAFVGDDGLLHNFHFTTEVKTVFEYEAGQTFSFTGDDDLWLFVNGRLALDLGGLHQAVTGTVDLDAQAADLGITPGRIYEMAIFHAERHTSASTFHIETTIECFIVN